MDKGMSIIFHRFGATDIPRCLLWRLGGRPSRSTVIYFHTFEVSLKVVAKLIGEAAVVAVIRFLLASAGMVFVKIIHGDKVAGYDDLHLGAITDATMILKDYHESGRYERRLVGLEGVWQEGGQKGGQGGGDDDSPDSLDLKTMAVDLWIVLENIMVVKGMAACEVSLCLPRGYFPAFVLEEIEKRCGAAVIDGGRIKNLFAAVPLFFYVVVSLSRKLGRLGAGEAVGGEKDKRYLVAAELVDDECLRGRPGDADYLASDLGEGDLLLYVTGEQRRFLSSLKAEHERCDVVDLSTAGIAPSAVFDSFTAQMKVVRTALTRGGSNFFLKNNIVYIDRAVDLDILFSSYRIKSHIYSTHLNGRTVFRYDSGLVTGLCRKYGVRSIGLQTRSSYSMGNEYCFNSFDTYCMWGEAWVEAYRDYQFVREYEIVGSIFLDGYAAMKPHLERDHRKLTLFPTAIITGESHHYTLTCTVDFLLASIGAVSSINEYREGKVFRVAVKVRDPEDVRTLMSSERYRAGVEALGVDVEYITSRRHDIEECINESDVVIAIGFTTPGMDAFLLGKKAAYYSNFENVNALFRDGRGLVLRSSGEVKRFLTDGASVPADFVDSLDPFRDGRARERIVEVIKNGAPRSIEARSRAVV